jgi:hypothetical protein
MPGNMGRLFPAQSQESFLHDLAGALHVVKNPERVSDQGSLVESQSFNDPFGFWGVAHSAFC